ncbi:NAD-binding protein [Mycobacterium sp. NAZ190054]|uniref:NAD-binding protein n=1 Tax=Mycobacterium sp. NAZ190054 TaxID=1747766 RepID=UPI000B05CDB9|nr:NAD-binding protein [Mycobacterium sp. NAZ190054]
MADRVDLRIRVPDRPRARHALPLDRAKYVISAIPELQTNLALLHGLREHRFAGTVALTAHTRRDADLLRSAGVDVVLEPFSAAAHSTSEQLHRLMADDSGPTA